MANQNEVALHLDISVTVLKELIGKKVLRPRMSLDDARVAYIRHLRAIKAGWKKPENEALETERYNFERERARLTYHQANKAALEEAHTAGRLVELDLVAKQWADRTMRMRAGLLGLPNKMASVALAANSMAEVREFCEQQIEHVLNELSTDNGDTAEAGEAGPDTAGGAETADTIDGIRMGRSKPAAQPGSKR